MMRVTRGNETLKRLGNVSTPSVIVTTTDELASQHPFHQSGRSILPLTPEAYVVAWMRIISGLPIGATRNYQ